MNVTFLPAGWAEKEFVNTNHGPVTFPPLIFIPTRTIILHPTDISGRSGGKNRSATGLIHPPPKDGGPLRPLDGVGGLKVANAAANAWAEQIPLLILSGAPGVVERESEPMLHHRVKDFDTQLRVFADLTCAQAVLNSPHNAASEIDRVIRTMISTQRPGYIEVPRDAVTWEIDASDHTIDPHLPPVDAEAQREAIEAVLTQLRGHDSAAIHAGAMIERRDLGSSLFDLATSLGIPVATSSLARGCFPERHELGLGVYLGALSPEHVVQRVEGADVLLSLGVMQTDLTLGAFTANIDHHRLILATDTEVTVGYCTYKEVPL